METVVDVRWRWICHIWWLFLFMNTSAAEGPLYFLTTPNLLRLETDETVTVTTYGAYGATSFKIYLEDYPDRKGRFSERTVLVEKDEIANVTIKLTSDDLIGLSTLASVPSYVYLVSESPAFVHPTKAETILPLSTTPGYIFIQTDKPLYTPEQTVYLRVISLNEDFKPASWPLQIDILNPKGLVVSRQNADGKDLIFKDSLQIPDNPVYGNWSVRVKFTNVISTTAAVRFEVKEYVLPIYEVKFSIDDDQRVILQGDKEFRTTINAKYVFGKPVKGHVTVTFGLMWHGHVYSLGKKRNIELNDTGQAVCTITVNELRIPVESVWFPNGGKLHLEASVTEYASGKVESAWDNSVVFAEYLYIIKFTRSSRHFKPGLSYTLKIDVIRANGKPGKNLPLIVTAQGKVLDKLIQIMAGDTNIYHTDSKGHLDVDYLIAPDTKSLQFKVEISESGGEPQTGTAVFYGAVPFFSESGTYLQIKVFANSLDRRGQDLEVGDDIVVMTHYTSPEALQIINLLVLSRGHIVWQSRTNNLGSNTTSFHFPLARNMIPRIRIIAFSICGSELGSEVVSDSVWMDLKPSCYGEIQLSLSEDSRPHFRPGDIGSLKIEGLPGMHVGMLAVDQAVYFLNRKSFTRQSIFDALMQHDLGCGLGSVENSPAVFQTSGLVVLTNAGLITEPRSSEGCEAKAVRRRRATMEEVCCQEGIKLNLKDPQQCHKAAKVIQTLTGLSECAHNFFQCCYTKNITRPSASGRIQGVQDKQDLLFELSLDDDTLPVTNDIPIRSNFPESWWFDDFILGPEGKDNLDFTLPDSITTWVIQAIGVSMETGLCVAPPLNLTAFKPFFVHVDLPYSAVRLEQLEVRATVYNYMQRTLKVRLYLQSVEGVCYSGVPGHISEAVQVSVAPNDATSAYFPIVPLEIGKFSIKVFAISPWGRDAVEKVLKVEGEGLEKIHIVSVPLDPSGRRFWRGRHANHTFSIVNKVIADKQKQEVELDLDLPAEVIPETESCSVSAMGDILGPTVRGVVDGVEELLRLPTGCGEQNLIHMGPNIYVLRYLRSVGRLTSAVEKKAKAFIRQGLMRQMTFKKDDGSFGTWPHAPSSTWLTAFAMKILCQTNHFVEVDINSTCTSLEWLRTRQRADGSFIENVWVTHREMLGGINGDVSVTAFVLIAMLECPCSEKESQDMVYKAVDYLERHLEETQRPLVVAISAYALALAGRISARNFNAKLMDMALTTPQGLTYWGYANEEEFGEQEKPYWYLKKPSALSVETTAYALLTQLTLHDINASNPIVAWLLQQREEHGSFVSTQDTVIGLQALSEYSIKSFSTILDMTCHLSSDVDEKFQKTFSLTREDALVLKSVPEVPTGGKLHLEASGTGVGVMHVDVRFNVPQEDTCNFELSVTSRRLSNMLQHFFWQPQQ